MKLEKFLIVDDALYQRKHLRKILEDEGYIVVGEATNGVEALEKYREYLPDFVFMDLIMPECNGVNAVKEILEYDSKANIIIVSAVEQKNTIFEAIEAGALNYLNKPYKPSDLLGVINLTAGYVK